MLFTLLFAGSAALICLVLYNSGMLANSKTQLQNAADAGAYSGGILLARDHNFSAYTNRAMVANQVSVAQLVSMKSFVEDAAATSGRIRGGAHTTQYNLVPVFAPTWLYATKVPVATFESAYNKVAPGVVVALDKLIDIFDKAQRAHHEATFVNVVFTADEVVKRNDPHASISKLTIEAGYILYQLNAWRDYTAQHQANGTTNVADRFANVVVDKESTDEFVRKRTSTLPAGWVSFAKPSACPGGVPVGTVYAMNHGGGTLLSADKKRWLALDATMGAGVVFCVYEVLPVPVPLIADGFGGSGGGLVGSSGGYGSKTGFSGNPSDAKQYGHATTDLLTRIPAGTRYTQGPGASMDGTGGLQNYYRDLADVAKTSARPKNQTAAENGGAVPFTIEVQREGSTIRTSGKVLGSAAATINAKEELKGDKLRTLASAQAFFYRANADSAAFTKTGWARSDGKTEMANLFNPYWQTSLVDNPNAAYLLSIGAP